MTLESCSSLCKNLAQDHRVWINPLMPIGPNSTHKNSCRNSLISLCFNLTNLKALMDVLLHSSDLFLDYCNYCNSRLGYCNSLLYGYSQANIHKLQRVQNVIAKLVCAGNACLSDALCNLHWLPINQRIKFKLASLTYKLLQHQLPSYLASSIITLHAFSCVALTGTATPR